MIWFGVAKGRKYETMHEQLKKRLLSHPFTPVSLLSIVQKKGELFAIDF